VYFLRLTNFFGGYFKEALFCKSICKKIQKLFLILISQRRTKGNLMGKNFLAFLHSFTTIKKEGSSSLDSFNVSPANNQNDKGALLELISPQKRRPL
jgi:hypothetical protein